MTTTDETVTDPFEAELRGAKQESRNDTAYELKLALGGAGTALDDILKELWTDSSLNGQQKVQALKAVASNARNIVQAAMSGSPAATPLGAGAGDSADDSQETVSKADYDRVSGELETAQASVRVLTRDRATLEQVASDLGMTLPTDSTTPFPADTRQRVKSAVDTKVQEAADAATPANTVDQAKVRASYDKIVVAFKGLSTSWASNEIKGEDDLDKALDGLEALLS